MLKMGYVMTSNTVIIILRLEAVYNSNSQVAGMSEITSTSVSDVFFNPLYTE